MRELCESGNNANTSCKICHECNLHRAVQSVYKVPSCEWCIKLLRSGILYWGCTISLRSTPSSALYKLLKALKEQEYKCNRNLWWNLRL